VTRRRSLGEFEQLLLLAVLRLGEEAYGVTVRREIERRTGRSVSLGAIYPTMDRLEEKGLLTSCMGEPTGERGGRSRRYFTVLPAGVEALHRARATFLAMWEGLEPDPESST
jgi:DNA-binding PadR family transcriptional regulator